MTPKITLSLMVTNAEELATMLAVLRQHDTHDNAEADNERARWADEHEARLSAEATAIGWQRTVEESHNRFIAATNQLEQAQRTVKWQSEEVKGTRDALQRANREHQIEVDRLTELTRKAVADARDAQRERDQMKRERDECSELLAKANERLDGGPNQRVSNPSARILEAQNRRDDQCTATRDGRRCERYANHEGEHQRGMYPGKQPDETWPSILEAQGFTTELQRDLQRDLDRTPGTDLHPDEDPRDHLDPEQCRATRREDWTGPLGNAQWSITYCGGKLGHAGEHTGGVAGDRVTWTDYHDAHACERGTGCCDS